MPWFQMLGHEVAESRPGPVVDLVNKVKEFPGFATAGDGAAPDSAEKLKAAVTSSALTSIYDLVSRKAVSAIDLKSRKTKQGLTVTVLFMPSNARMLFLQSIMFTACKHMPMRIERRESKDLEFIARLRLVSHRRTWRPRDTSEMIKHHEISRHSSTSLPPCFFVIAQPAFSFIDGPGEDHVSVAPFWVDDKTDLWMQEQNSQFVIAEDGIMAWEPVFSSVDGKCKVRVGRSLY